MHKKNKQTTNNKLCLIFRLNSIDFSKNKPKGTPLIFFNIKAGKPTVNGVEVAITRSTSFSFKE